MIHAGIYPRKSKQVDNSDSMSAQIDMCKAYLDNKYGKDNYILHIYDGDYGITGHSIKNRKDFQRMMRDMKSIPLNMIAIQRYDRIARNTRDFCNLYHEMEQAGCDLVSVSQQIDTSTPYGKKFMYDQASMAELEWALCSERRKDANRYARSVGKYTCRPDKVTLGYKVEKIDGIPRLVKDKEKEQAVIDLFDHYKKYTNYSACAKYINDKYGMTYTVNGIKYLIKNTLYKGQFWDNENFCEPYLTIDEWNELQRKKPVVKFSNKKNGEVLFSGLIRCPVCGRKMRAQNKKHRNGTTGRYYHCEYRSTRNCSNNRVRSESIIEKQLLDKMEEFLSNIEYDFQVSEHKEKKVENTQKYKQELERLNTMFQKGRVDENYYDAEYERIINLISISTKLKEGTIDIEKVKGYFSLNWKETYNSLDKLHRKLFWKQIIERIVIDENMDVVGVIFL